MITKRKDYYRMNMNKYIKRITLLLLICIPLFTLQAKSKHSSSQKKKTQSSSVSKKKSAKKKAATKKKSSRKKSSSKKRSSTRVRTTHHSVYVAQPFEDENVETAEEKTQSAQKPQTSASSDDINYIHTPSQTTFPIYMGEYKRSKVLGESNSDQINVMYRLPSKAKKPSFIITISRSEDAVEGRLRNEYRNDIQKVAEVEKLPLPLPTVLREVGNKYTCYGVAGTFTLADSTLTQLRVYECGTWMMKILFSTLYTKQNQLEAFADSIVRRLDPTRLTSLTPLNTNASISFERELLIDTVFTPAMIAAGMSKVEWAQKNVWPREKASGFPDLYFNMHVHAIDTYLEEAAKKNLTSSATAAAYYKDLKAIKEAGFMSEFIMDQFSGIVIISPAIRLDFNRYYKWLETQKLTVNLNKPWYNIVYRKN